jgi:hypothetical protein
MIHVIVEIEESIPNSGRVSVEAFFKGDSTSTQVETSVAKYFMDGNTDLVKLFGILSKENDALIVERLSVGGESMVDEESAQTD